MSSTTRSNPIDINNNQAKDNNPGLSQSIGTMIASKMSQRPYNTVEKDITVNYKHPGNISRSTLANDSDHEPSVQDVYFRLMDTDRTSKCDIVVNP